MDVRSIKKLFFLLNILAVVLHSLTLCEGNTLDIGILNVGEELWRETLKLQAGSRLYLLQRLKPLTWYEVKISYPASIPAAINLQLKTNTEMAINRNRKLLNIEKLIFKTENLNSIGDQENLYILVTVEPEGVVAIPNVGEREFILFNIVCDELLLGIPNKAWGAAILVLICVVLALFVPFFLPPWLLLTRQNHESKNQHVTKNS